MTPSRDDILADLNPAQRQAVLHAQGPLLVLAGPGSGKTRVITRRAACLVHAGAQPSEVLAITFTNKAADEMRRRIEALGVARGMWAATFHAFGARLLRGWGAAVGIAPDFTIYDEADQMRVIREAFEAGGVSPEALKPEQAQAEISGAKNRLQTWQDYLEAAGRFEDRATARVYECYDKLMRDYNALDFDDLLMRVAILLRDHEDVTSRLNRRFRYTLIDEYQDTNHAQYLLAKFLTREHRNICATGDPDQSIYGWRGADVSNILEFERDYADATIVRLEQNYRSTRTVLRIASALIAHNERRKHKELWTENEPGEPAPVWEFEQGRDEARHIAQTIAQLRRAGHAYSDCAIFYRVNAVSRGLEEALRDAGIPYRIARGLEFYNRKEIRDTLGYLRVLTNPRDEVALLRIVNTPARGIGKTTIDRLRRAAAELGKPLNDVLRDVDLVPTLKPAAATKVRGFVTLLGRLAALKAAPLSMAVAKTLELSGLEGELKAEREAGGEDRLANVEELVTAAATFEQEHDEPTLESFLQHISLASDQDAVDESAGVVLLMTLHAAKGLEFPVVFIAGFEQGLLPHERAIRQGDVEEERRLCFVGVTRAQRRLFLSRAQERLIRGAFMPRAASQFLRELPEDAIEPVSFAERRGEPAPRAGLHYVPDDDESGGGGENSSWSRSSAGRWGPRGRAGRRGAARPRSWDDEPSFSVDDPTLDLPPAPSPSPYREWKAGMLVRHARHGVGQLVWIQPGGGQTRACVRFAGLGEKIFILEFTPMERLG